MSKRTDLKAKILNALHAAWVELCEMERSRVEPLPPPGHWNRIRHMPPPDCALSDQLWAKLEGELSLEEQVPIMREIHGLYGRQLDVGHRSLGFEYQTGVKRLSLLGTIKILEEILEEGRNA